MKKLLKNPKILISLIIVIIVVIIAVFVIAGKQDSPYEFATAKRITLLQEVSVTGKVQSAEDVSLAFERSGKISRVSASIGDKVAVGQVLVVLENQDLLSELREFKANFEAEQARLRELEKGTREEEIQSAQTKVENAERSLLDAENNLVNVKNQADVDLREAYEAGLTAVQKAVVVGKTSLLTLTDIQYNHFLETSPYNVRLADAKKSAVLALLGQENASYWNAESIGKLTGGAFELAQAAVDDPSNANINTAILKALDGLQKIKLALDAVPITTALTATERTNLSTEKSNINTEIVTVSGKDQAISVQEATNTHNIVSAETKLTDAKNTLSLAQDDLNLKKAGATIEQIEAQAAKVKSAQARVQNIEAGIAKTIMRSPIQGIVIKKDAQVGEIVSSGVSVISLISDADFQIEANIPEADIAKVKIGDTAQVTLDAYGDDVVFEARVIKIEPAETIIEGVATYKTTLEFIQKDERIKSGMTANTDILTAKRENVIAVPQGAVIQKDGNRYVAILQGSSAVIEVEVKTGIRGSDGNIEIIEGLEEGQEVIISGL